MGIRQLVFNKSKKTVESIIEVTSAGSRNWWGIASSADGTKLAAAPQSNYIYTITQ